MAISLGDAILYLKSNNKGLDEGLGKAETKTKSWAGRLGGKIGPLIGGAVVGAATIAAGAVVGIGAAAFNVANEVRDAARSIEADLGTTREEAERLADVGLRVFGNNFADNIGEAGKAVGLVRQQLGDLGADDLQDATENAFRLRDAYGVDLAEGIDAARTLMENFDLTQQEAFDHLALGFQRGLNRSDDFIDTIGEYSTQFATGGASAAEFFGLLEDGLQGGMLGTDKVADLFKEFRIRLTEGSSEVQGALNSLGFDAEETLDKISDGSLTAADLFGQITTALGRTEDPIAQMTHGVAIMGTQFEDLGNAALFLDTIPDSFENVAGSIDAVDAKYDTLGSAMEGYKRRFLVAIEPVGQKLLSLANEAMPHVEVAFQWMEEHLPAIIDTVVDAITQGMDFLTGNVGDNSEQIQRMLDALQQFWEQHGENILAVLRNLKDIGTLLFDTFVGNVIDILTLFFQIMTGDWEGAEETVLRIVGRMATGLGGLFEELTDSILRILDGFMPGMYEAGSALIDNLWNGLKAKWSGVQTWWEAKTQWFRDMWPGSEPKNPDSPLRGLDKAGEALIGNIQAGLDRAGLNMNPIASNLTPAAAGLGGGASVTVQNNFYGPADAATVERGSRNGVLSAMRAAGLR